MLLGAAALATVTINSCYDEETRPTPADERINWHATPPSPPVITSEEWWSEGRFAFAASRLIAMAGPSGNCSSMV